MQPYTPLLMLVGLAIVAATTMIVASHFLGPRRPTDVKERPYESGMPPLGDAHERFSVKFCMVAVLFILFDIETVFMIPWGAYYRQLSCTTPLVNGVCPAGRMSLFGFSEMLVLIIILLVGFIYVWKK